MRQPSTLAEGLPPLTIDMSSPAQTPASSKFNQILEAALSKYQKKTGKNILSHPLAVELHRCDSIDAVLAILQGQAEAVEQFRSGNERLMEGIRLSVDVLSVLSNTLGEGVSLVRIWKPNRGVHSDISVQVFPPAKTIFCGIGILLAVRIIRRSFSHILLVTPEIR